MRFPNRDEFQSVDRIRLAPVPVDFRSQAGNDEKLDRTIGSMMGLALGDALGASVEFRPNEYLVEHPVTTMTGGGTWGLEVGQWTDDTSMALCLASSLIDLQMFDPYNQMVRYKWWNRSGYLSSTGHCFDIGQATAESINSFCDKQKSLKIEYRCLNESETDHLSFDSVERSNHFKMNFSNSEAAGNGCLMRLAPVPLFYEATPEEAVRYSSESCRLTHGNKLAVDACRYFAALICAAFRCSKEEILNGHFFDDHRSWFGEDQTLSQEILDIDRGSYKRPNGYQDGIRGKGFVVQSLEAALWAFWSTDDFRTGALAAVNLGDDTDTTAAIYGQLAGAYYGYKNLPSDWLQLLYAKDLIESVGQWLFYLGHENSFSDSKINQAQLNAIARRKRVSVKNLK